MSIATNIKLRRLQLGLTQEQLAKAIGYQSRSAIAKIENGLTEVPLSKLIPLSRALDTTAEGLLEGAEGQLFHNPVVAKSITPNMASQRTAVVILAGGRSTRSQNNIPNQFATILGKPVVVYCMDAYQQHPQIDEIYVICLDGFQSVLLACAKRYGIDKLRNVIPAGKTGIESARMGLAELVDNGYMPQDIVVFQESTRPLISIEMITKLLKTAQNNGSAAVGRTMSDNVQFYRNREGPLEYLDRNQVVDLQSPDAYRISHLTEVFRRADACNHIFSESNCSMLLYNLNMSITFCEAPHTNIKIVRQDDLDIATALLRKIG